MLQWPDEGVRFDETAAQWQQAGSNILLDFHGDPAAAGLSVFSDGNHHMALEETLQLFRDTHPDVGGVFYATTPPGPLLQLLRKGSLKIGNFILSATPHLFLGPPPVLDKLVAEGTMASHKPFMKNRGSVLLVRKENPKRIAGPADLAREDVRLFLPNPVTETVSYGGYAGTIKAFAAKEGFDASFLAATEPSGKIFFGQCIHHREAPEAVAAGLADVAVVYYHLALRYIRIFPDIFDMVPLGGTKESPEPGPENPIGFIHAGLIRDGGRWGKAFLEFLFTRQVADIYTGHGLEAIT